MGEVAATALFSAWHCQPLFCLGRGRCFGPENFRCKLIKKRDGVCRAKALFNSVQSEAKEPLTLYFRYNIDAPLCESPGATFDQYLEDEHRVCRAILPDKAKTQLSEEEWKVRMPAMQAMFLTIYLVLFIKLRSKSMGKDYPPLVPQGVSKILQLDITRWELVCPSAYEPGDLSLCVKGTIFSERQGEQSWLRNILDINLSFVVPSLLAWVPDSVMRGIAESIVKKVMEDVKLNVALLTDYDKFKKGEEAQGCGLNLVKH